MMESKTKYYASLDILKTVAAVLTLFFHCNMHLGIHFGFFTPFISQGAIAMDLFFMLSGYALFVGYYAKELDAKSILTFYKRRLVSIYPLYALVMVAFWLIPSYRSPLRSVLISLPVELSLMQSWFSGMFGFSHNGGTWFLSCLVFCYAVFPGLLAVAKRVSRDSRYILLLLCWLFCALIPLMSIYLEMPNVYSNPLLRMLEFFGGILLAAELCDRKILGRPTMWLAGVTICGGGIIGVVTKLYPIEILRNGYVTYGFATFPLFLLLVAASICVECGYERPLPLAHWWKTCADHAYAVFMAQFFLWPPIRKLKEILPQAFAAHENGKTPLLTVVFCLVLTIILQDCYNSPAQKRLFAHLYKKEGKISL